MSTETQLNPEEILARLQGRGRFSLVFFVVPFALAMLFPAESATESATDPVITALLVAYFVWALYWTIVSGLRGRGLILLLVVLVGAPYFAIKNFTDVRRLKGQIKAQPAPAPQRQQATANQMTAPSSKRKAASPAPHKQSANEPVPAKSATNGSATNGNATSGNATSGSANPATSTDLKLAYKLLKQHKAAAGIQILENALAENPYNVKALLLMGHAMRGKRNYPQAQHYYERAASLGSIDGVNYVAKLSELQRQ